jgi:hypothetical protein
VTTAGSAKKIASLIIVTVVSLLEVMVIVTFAQILLIVLSATRDMNSMRITGASFSVMMISALIAVAMISVINVRVGTYLARMVHAELIVLINTVDIVLLMLPYA